MHNTAWASLCSVLEGQTLVVIGGDRREGALSRLALAFGLSDVIHCRTRKNDASPRSFESSLRHLRVLLVVWALGLSRTHHGEQLHAMCRKLGIPWVDCFRIPHPNMLSARIEELRLLDTLRLRRTRLLAACPSSPRQIGGAA